MSRLSRSQAGGSIALPRYGTPRQPVAPSGRRGERENRDRVTPVRKTSRAARGRAQESRRDGRRVPVQTSREATRREGRAGAAERILSAGDWAAHHRVIVTVFAVVLVAVVGLYGPARDYYVARRTGEVLQQKYDDIASQNSVLTADVQRLQTKEGIEDEARKRGYVLQGETAVTVEGLSDHSQSDPSAVDAYQDDRSMTTKLLDTVFGYDPEATWNA